MSSERSFFSRSLIVTSVIVAAIASDRLGGSALASPSPAPSTALKKAPPPPVDPSKRDVIDDCTRKAYAELVAETAKLRALFVGDSAGFAREYARKKDAFVGQSALKARGCAPSRKE